MLLFHRKNFRMFNRVSASYELWYENVAFEFSTGTHRVSLSLTKTRKKKTDKLRKN